MTTNKKEIKINPDLFKISGTKNKKEKTMKNKPQLNIKTNTIRRDLIKKIKERKKLASKESFDTSVNLFNEVKEFNEKSNQPQVKENIPLEQNISEQQNIETNETNLRNEPPYSNLKNSSKPTYREWKNITQKNTNQYQVPDINFNVSKKKNKQNKNYIKRTIKHYDKFGKKNRTISVLVKDRNTRKKIDNEINLLRKHELSKIKDYLRDRGLIKIGSNAPENVLRETYENAYLCGNINNNNKDVMLHNYLNGETK